MKKALLIIAAIILLSGGIGIGYLIWGDSAPFVFEFTAPTTNTPAPQPGFDCNCSGARSDILIDAQRDAKNPNVLGITAVNKCMSAYRPLEIKTLNKVRHHSIIALYGAMYSIDARSLYHSVDALYFYNFGRVGLGGGVNVIFGGSKLYDIGPKIGIKGEF